MVLWANASRSTKEAAIDRSTPRTDFSWGSLTMVVIFFAVPLAAQCRHYCLLGRRQFLRQCTDLLFARGGRDERVRIHGRAPKQH